MRPRPTSGTTRSLTRTDSGARAGVTWGVVAVLGAVTVPYGVFALRGSPAFRGRALCGASYVCPRPRALLANYSHEPPERFLGRINATCRLNLQCALLALRARTTTDCRSPAVLIR